MTCLNPKNLFCFVCGLYTKSHHKRSIMTKPLVDAYEVYFKIRTKKANYPYGPPSVCNDCNNALLRWNNGVCPKAELPFEVPMIWSQPRNHQTDCYFCLTRPLAHNRRQPAFLNQPISYPNNLKSAIKPRRIGIDAGPPQARRSRFVPVTPNAARHEETVSVPPRRATIAGNTQKIAPPAIAMVTRKVKLLEAPPPTTSDSGGPIKQLGPVIVAGMKRKSSDTVSSIDKYDVTKVRLRSSEPSLVLERSEKRLPSMARRVVAAGPPPSRTYLRSMAPVNTPRHPKITSVFSLQGQIPPYPSFVSTPSPFTLAANGQQKIPITIEIDDDDDEEQDIKKEDEDVKEEEDVEEHEEEEKDEEEEKNEKMEEEQEEEEKEKKVQLVAEPNVVIKTEMEEEQIQEQNVITASSEHQLEEKPKLSAGTGFINIHSLPVASSTGSSKMVVVKMGSPYRPPAAPQPTSSEPRTVPSPSAVTSPVAGAIEGRIPHLITQSELILLLRELELTKEKSAILINRLKQWNLLAARLVCANRVRPVGATQEQQPATTIAASPPVRVVGGTPPRTRPAVITTLTCGQRRGETAVQQSFIKVKPTQLLQSNTITTSHSNMPTTVQQPNGGTALRQQVVGADGTAPIKREPIASS